MLAQLGGGGGASSAWHIDQMGQPPRLDVWACAQGNVRWWMSRRGGGLASSPPTTKKAAVGPGIRATQAGSYISPFRIPCLVFFA